MNERIEQLLEELRMSRNEFAEQLDVETSSISHYITGRNKPSISFLTALAQKMPQVNVVWLLTGKGDIISDKNSSNHMIEEDGKINLDDISTQNTSTTTPPLSNKGQQADKIKSNKHNYHSNTPKNSILKVITLYADGTFSEYSNLNTTH